VAENKCETKLTEPSRPALPGLSGSELVFPGWKLRTYPSLDNILWHGVTISPWPQLTNIFRTFKTLGQVVMNDIATNDYKPDHRSGRDSDTYRTSPLSMPIPNAIVAQTYNSEPVKEYPHHNHRLAAVNIPHLPPPHSHQLPTLLVSYRAC
jgi:hypothetical protein